MTKPAHHATAPEDIIPFGKKAAFGVGMLGNQLFPAAMGVFMVVLIQGLGMSPLLWGLIFFLPRILDAVTDPIMGFISDNTKSRWGRRRPYIFIGAIMTGVTYIIMWQVHAENSEMYNFIYFLSWSLVFYVGLTIFATPYVALGYEMSNDFHERTRLMAVSQWIGQWAWVIAPWFWVILYNPKLFDSPAAGARGLAVWVGLLCMVLALVPALLCRTRYQVPPESLQKLNLANMKNNLTSFGRGFKDTFTCRPFLKLCAATFLVFSGFNTVAAFSWFIIVYHMYGGDPAAAGNWPAWFGTVSALSTTFLVIPIVTFMSQKLGKKTAFTISQSISIVGYILFWWCFKPGQPFLMFLPLPFFAFGIGGLFTLMMSMTADVCDYDELCSGGRREGTFGAIYWWMVKFGLAFAGLLSGVILRLVGFDQNIAVQTPGALFGLRLAYVIVPVLGALLAIAAVSTYEITETRAYEIRAELEQRRGKAKPA
ncbi:MAG: MFS transporter [Kiritimatiellae bacterium]|nr:MFS transporter [Kiritimatiellia bacterium]